MAKDDLRRNAEGYLDPTAYEAMRNCELSDFHIEERIVIKDKRTGKVWR